MDRADEPEETDLILTPVHQLFYSFCPSLPLLFLLGPGLCLLVPFIEIQPRPKTEDNDNHSK